MRRLWDNYSRLMLWPIWLWSAVIGRPWPVRVAVSLVVFVTVSIATVLASPAWAMRVAHQTRCLMTPLSWLVAVPAFAAIAAVLAPLEALCMAVQCALGQGYFSPTTRRRLDELFGADEAPREPCDAPDDNDDDFGGGLAAAQR